MRGSVFRSCSVKREEPWLGMEGGFVPEWQILSGGQSHRRPTFLLRRASSTDFSTVSESALGMNPCRTVATFAFQLDALSIWLDLIHITLISEANLELMWKWQSSGFTSELFKKTKSVFSTCTDEVRETKNMMHYTVLSKHCTISLKSYTKHIPKAKAPILLITETSSCLLISFSTCF